MNCGNEKPLTVIFFQDDARLLRYENVYMIAVCLQYAVTLEWQERCVFCDKQEMGFPTLFPSAESKTQLASDARMQEPVDRLAAGLQQENRERWHVVVRSRKMPSVSSRQKRNPGKGVWIVPKCQKTKQNRLLSHTVDDVSTVRWPSSPGGDTTKLETASAAWHTLKWTCACFNLMIDTRSSLRSHTVFWREKIALSCEHKMLELASNLVRQNIIVSIF